MTGLPYEEISGWIRESPTPPPPLGGDRHADVVVIGAGYTGLSAALALREQGVNVVVGVTGDQDKIHYGFGYAGHGVAQATLMGAMLADRVLGCAHECEKALARRLWSWPPEPLRYAAYQMITRALYAVDARTDRQTRKLRVEEPTADLLAAK